MKCLFCNAELIGLSEIAASEISDYEEDDGAVVCYLECPDCGRFYEIWEPKREERERDYKDYWENGDKR